MNKGLFAGPTFLQQLTAVAQTEAVISVPTHRVERLKGKDKI